MLMDYAFFKVYISNNSEPKLGCVLVKQLYVSGETQPWIMLELCCVAGRLMSHTVGPEASKQ